MCLLSYKTNGCVCVKQIKNIKLVSNLSNPLLAFPQKRKAESVSLATQASPATPVPSLPDSAEASQASVYPAGRDTNAFNAKGRDDHEQLSSLTTVRTRGWGL